jgi:rhodanese-related sulfurtransferase
MDFFESFEVTNLTLIFLAMLSIFLIKKHKLCKKKNENSEEHLSQITKDTLLTLEKIHNSYYNFDQVLVPYFQKDSAILLDISKKQKIIIEQLEKLSKAVNSKAEKDLINNITYQVNEINTLSSDIESTLYELKDTMDSHLKQTSGKIIDGVRDLIGKRVYEIEPINLFNALKDYYILDLRYPEEIELDYLGAIDGSIVITDFNKEIVKYRDKPIVLVCRKGERALYMAHHALFFDLPTIHVLKGGMEAWHKEV